MTKSSDREIVHFIARILGARETATVDVPTVVENLRDTFLKLRTGADPAQPQSGLAGAPLAKVRLTRSQPGGSTSRPAGDDHAGDVPRRRRGRPPRAAQPSEPASRRPEPVVVPIAAPRLMRRAEVAPAEPAMVELLARPSHTTLRGVVRWFDQRTRHALLRLPGFPEDVAVDEALIAKSGISRLFKGQEIDVTVAGENGGTHLVALALPGASSEPGGLFKTGTARRHAKPVVVEMKRDAMRRAAARVEAEAVLGGVGRDRPS